MASAPKRRACEVDVADEDDDTDWEMMPESPSKQDNTESDYSVEIGTDYSSDSDNSLSSQQSNGSGNTGISNTTVWYPGRPSSPASTIDYPIRRSDSMEANFGCTCCP